MIFNKTKVSVCYLVFSNGVGGAEQVVKQIIRNIDEAEFNPYLITNDELVSYYSDVLPSSNIFSVGPLYDLGSKYLSKIFDKLESVAKVRRLLLLRNKKAVVSFLIKSDVRVVHSHLMYDLYYSSLIKKLLPHVRVIYTIHGFLNLKPNESNRYILSHHEFINLLNSVDRLTAVSPLISEYISDNFRFCSGEVCFIPNGVDGREILSQAPSGLKKTRSGPLRVTYLGGEKVVKGGGLLLGAIERLALNGYKEKIEFSIFGAITSGGGFERVLNRVSVAGGNVKVYGYIESPKHLSYIKNSDLVVMPSISEGFPLVVMEAFSMGVPVIGSNIGIFNRLLHGEAIFEFNVEALGSLLIKACTENEFITMLAEHSSKYVVPYWEDVVRRYECEYRNLL